MIGAQGRGFWNALVYVITQNVIKVYVHTWISINKKKMREKDVSSDEENYKGSLHSSLTEPYQRIEE